MFRQGFSCPARSSVAVYGSLARLGHTRGSRAIEPTTSGRDPNRWKAVMNTGCTAILMVSCVVVLLTLAGRVWRDRKTPLSV